MITSSVAFEYFPFEVQNKGELTLDILQGISPSAEDWEIMKELSYLNVGAEVLYRPFETLSYGEQTKVLFVALFLKENAFLLIDEPTNHLDVEARKLVAAYLAKKKSFILISHDRNFVDKCVDHILSINKQNIEVVRGNYTTWYENRVLMEKAESVKNEKLKSEVAHMKRAAAQTEKWSNKAEKAKFERTSAGLRPDRGFIGAKAAKMMKRSVILENRQNQAIEEKSKLLKNVETKEALKMFPLTYHKSRLLKLQNVGIKYAGEYVSLSIDFR
jgi:lincosamide and streptogramin A transport system ATP-binding/permease protein